VTAVTASSDGDRDRERRLGFAGFVAADLSLVATGLRGEFGL
jgi:hypothetical protein